jgi:hypothetical protein
VDQSAGDSWVKLNSAGQAVLNGLVPLRSVADQIEGQYFSTINGDSFALMPIDWNLSVPVVLARTSYSWNQRRTNQAWQQRTLAVRSRPIQVGDSNDGLALKAVYQFAQHCYIIVKEPDTTLTTIEDAEASGSPHGTFRVAETPGDSKNPNEPTDGQYFVADDANAASTVQCLHTKQHQMGCRSAALLLPGAEQQPRGD